MLLRRCVVSMLSTSLMVMTADIVSGQGYPSKPIRVLTSSTGSGGDFVARLIAQGLRGALGQSVVIENRGGNLPAEIVSKAPPDGYTLLITGTNTWIQPLMQETATYEYDVEKDFSPITLAVWLPCILVVHPSLPAKSVRELIALAKARPGALNYGYAQRGAAPHLAAELFKSMAGVNIVSIGHSNTTLALTSLLSGELQLSFPAAGAVAAHLKSGRLRSLAVTSAEPSALFPGLPAIAATLPGYESVSVTAIFAPAKTPATIISRLNQEIVAVLNQADIREKFANAGIAVVGSSPEQLAAKVKSETARMGKVIRDAGIRVK